MADTKKEKSWTGKRLALEQIHRLKEAIRYCAFGDFTTENALKFINNGILGYTDKKDTEGNPIPVTVTRSTYFDYKEKAMDDNEIRKDFTDFIKSRYVTEMRNILSVVKMVMSLTQQNYYQTNDIKTKQFILNSMMKNLPAYTQYLEAIKILVEGGKLPMGETPTEEKDGSTIRS